MWGDNSLTLKLKLQLYTSGVCSILTHAHEAWKLTDDVCRRLRGWSGRHLALVTSGTVDADHIKLQTKKPVRDLVAMLRVRRLRWVGHVLRMDETRPERQILLAYNAIYPDGYPEGSVLMDAPCHTTVADLVPMAGGHGPGQHGDWGEIVRNLKAALV